MAKKKFPESVMDKPYFEAAFSKLTSREQAYLDYRFGMDHSHKKRTRKETAHHFYLTESWAKTTETHALEHLRELISVEKEKFN